ncbi:phasin family protein [Aromatoleum evansii]|uniref:phasin family protein n=1 Tax=Aromatoleum evansii TaxID=59406 RepID=UPI00145E157E|nr:phasin family protein [Aromatoleum evansii]NMG29670.1 TIGR01841 family phasin [Aromatoleum evansii]
MQTTTPEQIRAAKTYTNALMALSQVAFSGVERLAALNLNVARAALEDGISASNRLMQVKDISELKDLQGSISAPATEHCAAYFRSVQEIAGESQQQIAQIMTSYLATLGFDAAAKAGTNAGFDMFSKFVKETNSMFEANAKAVGDATTKMMAPVTSHPKKAA